MAGKSNIEWTGHTWNPIAGCSVLTPGCTNCYAMKMAARLERMGSPLYAGLTKPSKGGAVWTGIMRRANQDTLTAPLQRKKPTTYFVNSMSDLFHENVPIEWIADIFGVMAVAGAVGTFHREGDGCQIGPSWTTSDGREIPTKWPNMTSGPHTFQVLTKRANRMAEVVGSTTFRRMVAQSAYRHAHDKTPASQIADAIECDTAWPLPNVWLGVSTERQQEANERIPFLLQTPASVRFISAEPLLGPIDLSMSPAGDRAGWFCPLSGDHQFQPIHADHRGAKLDWVIVGGESGPGFRDMEQGWAQSLIDQCTVASVPVFMKQMAGKRPIPSQMLVRQFPVAA